MGAVSDVDAAHKSAKNPTMFRKVFNGGSIEQEAIEAFTAKKRLEEQRYELQQFIKFTHGTAAWDELLRMEGQIRKRRQQEIYDKKIFREKVIGVVAFIIVLAVGMGLLGLFVYSLMGLDRDAGSVNCVRKQGGQETFEWLCVEGDTIYLAKSENIKQCFTCFLKKFSDWTWEQEIRKGVREDPKYVTCRRYKRRKAKNGQQVCLYKGANDTYTLVVEGECPVEFQCRYDPGGQEPNIDSVVDSLNESFKK